MYGFSLDEFIFAGHREMHHISLASLILLRIPLVVSCKFMSW
ncbi:hypothetical protein SynSYN20_01508 [Synechococcus sp. SYN20]|nr:hypothetical protein SynSYN20_01508 [Synechococcus sp. SYN20]